MQFFEMQNSRSRPSLLTTPIHKVPQWDPQTDTTEYNFSRNTHCILESSPNPSTPTTQAVVATVSVEGTPKATIGEIIKQAASTRIMSWRESDITGKVTRNRNCFTEVLRQRNPWMKGPRVNVSNSTKHGPIKSWQVNLDEIYRHSRDQILGKVCSNHFSQFWCEHIPSVGVVLSAVRMDTCWRSSSTVLVGKLKIHKCHYLSWLLSMDCYPSWLVGTKWPTNLYTIIIMDKTLEYTSVSIPSNSTASKIRTINLAGKRTSYTTIWAKL